MTLDELYEKRDRLKDEINKHDINQYALKIFLNSLYGYCASPYAAAGDMDIARSITLTGQSVIKESSDILNDYVKSRTGKYNDIYRYGDTDSAYVSITPLLKHLDIPLHKNNKITKAVLLLAQDMEDYLNKKITDWSKRCLLTIDPRLVFKREAICDVGLFVMKKRYILHLLDDEGLPCDKFKYTGVDVVKTTTPKVIKPYIKKIVEHMISTRDVIGTNKLFEEAYKVFRTIPVEDMAFTMGVGKGDEYGLNADKALTDFVKRTPGHIKAAILYNRLLKEYNIKDQDVISKGDKVRYFYVKPNPKGIDRVGFKHGLPKEFLDYFEVDYEIMFEKMVFQAIDRLYKCVGWKSFHPAQATHTDLFDFLKK